MRKHKSEYYYNITIFQLYFTNKKLSNFKKKN